LLSKAIVFLATGALVLLKRALIGTRLVMGVLITEFIAMYRAVGISAAVAGTAGTVFSRLWGIMKANPFIALAAVIGIVVAAINYYIGRTQRAIDATIKMSQETFNNIHALKVYGAAIESINKKKEQGQKVEKEYVAILQRLLEAYPDLTDKIKLNTEAHEDNVKIIKDVMSKELDKLIEQNTKLLTLYDKQARQARILEGAWKLYLTTQKKAVEWASKLFWVHKKVASAAFGKTYEKAAHWLEKYGKGSKEAKKIESERLTVLKQTAEAMEKNDKAVKTIVRTLKEMGATETEIRKMGEGFANNAIKIKEMEKALEDTKGKAENIFKDYYENLDILRKADFAKTIKAMDAEIASTQKKNTELTGEAKLGYDVIAAIQAKHLLKFEDAHHKEVLSYRALHEQKQKILDDFILRIIEEYDKQTIAAHNAYQREQEAAEGNKKKMLEAEEKFNEKIKEQTEIRTKSIEAIHKVHNERVKTEQAKVVNELRKLHKKMADDLIDQLKGKYDELKTEVEKLMDDLKSLEESYNDAMRESKQKTMTEEEKWYDDRKELNRLMNEAMMTNDADTWEQAFDLAKNLGREITDESGNVIKSIEETTRLSQNLMTQIHAEQMKLLKEEIAEREFQMAKIKDDIIELEDLVKKYGEAVDEASKKELELEMEEAIKSISAANNIVTKFKDKWDDLESKTITLTVKVNDQSGGKFDTGPTEVSEAAPRKEGGFIERLTRGKKLPGFGGGDKIKALLEAGEWVINKNAVQKYSQKYGSAFFDALNNMTFNIEDLLGGAMKRMGGMIPQPAPVKYQSGGEVSSGSRGAGNTYNITFSPQFMTGDEMAMRNMAPELKRVLEDLDHRWGN